MVRPLRRLALSVLANPLTTRALLGRRDIAGTIFTMHRFASPDGTRSGARPDAVRQALAFLRGAGVDILAVEDLIARAAEGRDGARPAVAFTIDDGYDDFADIGWPVFAEFDAPATVFVTTGVADRAHWFWWDRVEWAMRHAPTRRLRLDDGPLPLDLAWETPAERRALLVRTCETMKPLPTGERVAVVEALAAQSSVPLPTAPPDEYRVMDWDTMRTLEARGARFGPHTVSHPILTQCTDADAAFEIAESVRRIRAELRQPSNVFCYPNGANGPREQELVQRAGMPWAVCTRNGHVRRPKERRWQVPRFGFPQERGMVGRVLLLAD